MTKRFTSILLLICLALCLLPAGSAQGISVDPVELGSKLSSLLAERMDVDLYSFYEQKVPKGTYAKVAECYYEFARINRAVKNAIDEILPDIIVLLDKLDTPYELVVDSELSWREAAAIYYSYDREHLTRILQEKLEVTTELQNEIMYITIQYPRFEDMVLLDTQADWYVCWMALLYFNTLYDDVGEEKDYVHPELDEFYLMRLNYPLDAKYVSRLKDGWYNARSKGTRRHMGSDIKVPAKSPIYSCTDGEVIATGTAKLSGNYVIVRDPMGYTYYYYHIVDNGILVQAGQYVKRGQNIALVGNTGNSDANHLHISISTPEDSYLNPYIVLSDNLRLQEEMRRCCKALGFVPEISEIKLCR